MSEVNNVRIKIDQIGAKKVSDAMSKLAYQIQKISSELDLLRSENNKARFSNDKLSKSFNKLEKKLLNSASSLQSVNNKLRLVIDSAENFERVQKKSFTTAGGSFKKATGFSDNFTISLQFLANQLEDVLKITTFLGDAIVLSMEIKAQKAIFSLKDSFKSLAFVLKNNPIFLIISALGLLNYAYNLLTQSKHKFNEESKKEIISNEKLISSYATLTDAQKEKRKFDINNKIIKQKEKINKLENQLENPPYVRPDPRYLARNALSVGTSIIANQYNKNLEDQIEKETKRLKRYQKAFNSFKKQDDQEIKLKLAFEKKMSNQRYNSALNELKKGILINQAKNAGRSFEVFSLENDIDRKNHSKEEMQKLKELFYKRNSISTSKSEDTENTFKAFLPENNIDTKKLYDKSNIVNAKKNLSKEIDFDKFNIGYNSLASSINNFDFAVLEAVSSNQLLTSSINSMGNNISNAISGILSGNQSLIEGFRNMTANILQDISALIVKMLVFKAIFESLRYFGFGAAVAVGEKIVGLSQGGQVNKLSTGGSVIGAGTATSDSIPTMLSNGEYVIKTSSVNSLGTNFLDKLNVTGRVPRFATGGYVSPYVTGLNSNFTSQTQTNNVAQNIKVIVVYDRDQLANEMAKSEEFETKIVNVARANKGEINS